MKPVLSLVIPFYNEDANVDKVAEGLARVLADANVAYELLLVDNGSLDDTQERILKVVEHNPFARLVEVETNRGYGGGVLAGLRQASGEILGFAAGDGQSDPEAVVQVLDKLRLEGLDLCKANRGIRNDGWTRAAISHWGNRVFHWSFPGLSTPDINGTPKLFTAALYKKLDLTSTDWFLDAEIVIKAHWLGASLGETDVESPAREEGTSNVRWTTILEFLRNVARFRFGKEMREWKREACA